MTKNGRGVSAKLTESEYKEWVKLGKGKWLRSFFKDSRFARAVEARPQGEEHMTQNEVELKIKEAIQSQQPVWLGVWLDIAGDYPVWLTLGNKPAQPAQSTEQGDKHE